MSQPTGHIVDVSSAAQLHCRAFCLTPLGSAIWWWHVTRGCAARPRALILNTFGVMKALKSMKNHSRRLVGYNKRSPPYLTVGTACHYRGTIELAATIKPLLVRASGDRRDTSSLPNCQLQHTIFISAPPTFLRTNNRLLSAD